MEFKRDKLRGKIKEMYGSESNFAEKIGLSGTTLSKKLNNKGDFTRPQIIDIVEALKLSDSEVLDIFFCKTNPQNADYKPR